MRLIVANFIETSTCCAVLLHCLYLPQLFFGALHLVRSLHSAGRARFLRLHGFRFLAAGVLLADDENVVVLVTGSYGCSTCSRRLLVVGGHLGRGLVIVWHRVLLL